MSGILFLNTQDLDGIRKFYQAKIGMLLWLDQGGCFILKHGNLMLGFCSGEEIPFGGLITFFYETREEVDEIYRKLKPDADGSPKVNEKYKIYHFYAQDPEGRRLEFQSFMHPLEPFLTGEELLLTRQRVQCFEERAVPKEVLRKIFSLCRYPSSTSESPAYTFSIVQSEDKKNQLIELFEPMNDTIRTAPCIMVVSSERKVDDELLKQVFIGTYHFSLIARLHGLGTDILKEIDREKVKGLLDLPEDDHVILAILLGYPMEGAWLSDESQLSNKIRFVD